MMHHTRMILLSTLLGLGACTGADGADGAPGADGDPGATGSNGSDGTNGSNGADGASSLLALTDEAPGANCAAGGTRIDSGIDDDGDGVLDPGEVDSTAYLCDGEAGAATLVTTTVIAPDATCPAGGIRVDHGVDDDRDGTLAAGEVDSSVVVCDGVDGVDGVDGQPGAIGPVGPSGPASLITTTSEPAGPNCESGGIRIDHGVDDDRNGVLATGEVDGTSYVCNGVIVQASCDAIQNYDASAADGVYTIRVGGVDQAVYCDMTHGGITYAKLGFGRHGTSYASYVEVAVADLQDPVLQQAYVALYNMQGGGAINLAVGYSSGNCCFQAAGLTTSYLAFGGSYLYPAGAGPSVQCGGPYNDPLYGFYHASSGDFSPVPMPSDYFATRPAGVSSACSVSDNPAFFWQRF